MRVHSSEEREQPRLRRAEIVAALSMATDLAMGQPVEFALKSCVLAMRLGEALGLAGDEMTEIYYDSLLRYVGCNAEVHAMAAMLGDELAFRRDFALIDMGRASELAPLVFRHLRRANAQSPPLAMVAAVARGMIFGQRFTVEAIAGHCEVAARLAERLGLGPGVQRCLSQVYERWDGRGMPSGLKGEAVAIAVRVVTFAQDAVLLMAAHSEQVAHDTLKGRSGGAYDPRVVDAFFRNPAQLSAGLDQACWETVLELDPEWGQVLEEDQVDLACLAIADFADLKSPFFAGHSRAVSALAAEAASRAGLTAADRIDLARAGLVHDLGQVAVPARAFAGGSPSDSEFEQLRLHPHYGERILSRAPALSRLAAIVGQHHERCDGSGYHRGTKMTGLSVAGRILAAAETYQDLIEPRAGRPATSSEAAAGALRRQARAGALDGEAVAAVLAAAGHRVPVRRDLVAGLTQREIDVLRLIARGQSMKEIARVLGISPKTADNHTQNVYAKIGVKTRGGAVLYAIEHGLTNLDS